MSSSVRATVLYDAPGPNAVRRNYIYTALTVVAVVLAGWWVLDNLAAHFEGRALVTPVG